MTIKDGIKLGIGFTLGSAFIEAAAILFNQIMFDNSETWRNQVKETNPARYEHMMRRMKHHSEEE